MHEIFHAVVHALEHSILIFPTLLISYLIIEYIENKTSNRFEKSKLLNSKFSPLVASVMGTVPQCSFSVVMTDLYSKKKIAVSTLIAIYLATSDEAVPILLSSGKVADLLMLLITKFIIATIVGYIIMFVTFVFTKKQLSTINTNIHTDSVTIVDSESDSRSNEESTHDHEHDEHEHHDDEHEHDEIESEHSLHLGCCGHHIENEGTEQIDIMHIIFHSLKVFGFIVAVNIVMNILIEFIGTDTITGFLENSSIFQPFIAGLIGLIPNCASSIVITELYVVGGLHFGAMVAGLCTNAGIAMVLLFKQNKNIKQNIAILLGLYLISTIVGLLLSFIPFM